MRGVKELNCLEKVKKLVFEKDGKLCCNPFNGKNAFEVTDEEFKKEETWYINSDYYKCCFGLLEKDQTEFENILRTACPNSKPSTFPDFVFSNGFIEHFQITSSRENRKGSEHLKKMNVFGAKVKRETDILKQDWNETPSFDRFRSKSWSVSNPQHSYEFLINSFHNNWENHLKSLSKYDGCTNIGIFLIEYSDYALNMCENVYEDWINGMSNGDMRGQEKFKYYRLTRDKKLLEYIYQFREQIQYVIFIYCQGIEIIKTDKIPYLLKLMPWDYIISPMDVLTVSSLYNISIPSKSDEK